MTNPTIKIVDVQTNEVIERDMNAAELKQYKLDQAESKAKAETEANQVAAKNAVLDRLGITAEEAALLLG